MPRLVWALAALLGLTAVRFLVVELPLTDHHHGLEALSRRRGPSSAFEEETLPGWHDKRLTHVLQFVDHHEPSILHWTCDRPSYHLVMVTAQSGIAAESWQRPPAPHSCFLSTSICTLPDHHSTSSSRRSQVEAVFRNECKLTNNNNAQFALFVFTPQPQQQQHNWLDLVASSVAYPASTLAWVLVAAPPQSSFSPSVDAPVVYLLDALPGFYLNRVLPSVNNNNTSLYSSELDVLFAYVKDFKTNYDGIRFHLAHRVRFSDLLSSPSPLLPPPPAQVGLSHVVFALPAFQLDTLHQNVVNHWHDNPPCLAGDFGASSSLSSRLPLPPPELVLLVAVSNNNNSYDNNTLLRALQPYHHCFSAVTLCPLRLTPEQDNRVLGSKLLFEAMLRGELCGGATAPTAGYALYLEPDITPVQPRWLTALAMSVSLPVVRRPLPWIIGSLFLGPSRFVQRKWLPRKHNADHLFFHVNGNAMYWLGGDGGEFARFYWENVKPYIERRHGAEGAQKTAMDLDFMEYLTHKLKRSSSSNDELVRRIQYTPLIGNLYFESRNLTQAQYGQLGELVLVHAKPSDKW